jgi:hypothetical protein
MHHATGGRPPQVLPTEKPRNRHRWVVLLALFVAAAAFLLGLYWPRPQKAKAAPKAFAMGWRPVTTFSGHGSTQTESFSIETGQWRIKWATKAQTSDAQISAGENAPARHSQYVKIRDRQALNSTPKPADPISLANKFRLIVHSSVSGRFVTVAADHQGAGSGIAYMAEEPRQFFFDIESSGLNWTVQVEEGLSGEEQNSN